MNALTPEISEKPLLIIKTGAAIDQVAAGGDFEDWIAVGMGLSMLEVRVCRVDQGEVLPEPGTVAGVVITGSPAMVTDQEDWSERAALWLSHAVAAAVPILGICYGHQLLAHALGGRVAADPSGREIGTIEVRLVAAASEDVLLGGLPSVFVAQATHQESVVELPPGAVELAVSSHPANHAFRIGSCAWGVQFHPEFDDDVMRAYLEARASIIKSEGLDTERILRDVQPSPVAAGVLGRFSKIVIERGVAPRGGVSFMVRSEDVAAAGEF